MRYGEYKQLVFDYLRDMSCRTLDINELYGTELIPKKIAVPFFIRAAKEFITTHNGDFFIDFSADLKNLRKASTKFDEHQDVTGTTWDLKPLKKFFGNLEYPTERIKFDDCSEIVDFSVFVEYQLSVVEANNGKATFKPYYERLINIKNKLNAKN
jgi:hypothetical protein